MSVEAQIVRVIATEQGGGIVTGEVEDVAIKLIVNINFVC